jgi:ParB/RepB/Spo0J family partition protein
MEAGVRVERSLPIRTLPGFPLDVGLDWTLGKLLDRARMVAQFDVDARTLDKALFRALQWVVGPDTSFDDDEGRIRWLAEKDRIATLCRDAVVAHLEAKPLTQTSCTVADSTFAQIPIERITPNPHNPRKTFDEKALAQLTDSVRSKGVLEPVLVRPYGLSVIPGRISQIKGGMAEGWFVAEVDAAGKVVDHFHRVGDAGFFADKVDAEAVVAEGRYELVAGERRYRAATAAGLKVLPAIVRQLSDREAAEVAVIENDQREDVPPLEQADGYKRLIDLGDVAEAIAVKIGRPVKYVTARLTLTHLVPELQEDVRGGKLPFGHAHLLARLQPADQLELCGHLYQQYGADRGRVCALPELKRRISSKSLFVLSGAPWKWDDATLVPAAGTCTACPKRSGNNRTLFDDLLEDGPGKNPPEVCTDGACFQKKRTAFVELQVKKTAEANGGESLKISTRYSTQHKDTLPSDRYEIVTKKEAKKLPADQVKTAVIVEGGYSDAGQDVGKLVQVRVKKSASSGPAEDDYKRRQAEQKRKADAGRAAAKVANEVVADKIAAAVGNTLTERHVGMLRHLAVALADVIGTDACREVANRRGAEKGDYQPTRAKKCVAEVETAGELMGFMAELIASRKSFGWSSPHGMGEQSDESKKFWAAFGVDRAALIAGARNEAKEKKAVRKAGKKILAGKPAADKRKAGAK